MSIPAERSFDTGSVFKEPFVQKVERSERVKSKGFVAGMLPPRTEREGTALALTERVRDLRR